jgi:protein O-mannosyl-transferase
MKRGATSRNRQRAGTSAGLPAGPLRDNRAGLLLIVAVLALTAYVYWPVSGYDFVSVDDSVYVTENPFLRGALTWSAVSGTLTSTYAHFWHPLTLLSLMLDGALFGKSPGAFHVTNLLLHLGSTLVLFLALVRMTGATGRSAFVAAMFALHPLHVESVAWIAERKDVLSTFFWMLTMWAWTGYARHGRRSAYWAAFASFALGLMAKPMLVTLPVTLLLLDVWPFARARAGGAGAERGWSGQIRAWLPLVREKIPFFILAVASGVAALFAQGAAVVSIEAMPVGTRAVNALVASGTYLVKMVWPVGLTVFYPMPSSPPVWAALVSLVVLVAVTVAAWRFFERAPYLAVGWAWYLVTLLPVSGIVQVGVHAMADRYTYVPLLGLFIMGAWGMTALAGPGDARRWMVRGAATVSVLALAVASRAQVTTWRDSAALWQHALAVTSDNYYAQHGMGSLLREQGRAGDAVPFLRESIRLNPRFPDAHNNLGMALEALGRTDDAVAEYLEALRLDPAMAFAHNNLGSVHLQTGRADEAAAQFTEALRESPDLAGVHDNLGQARAARGRFADARTEYVEALRLQPDFAAAHAHLGDALANMGKGDEAIAQYRESLRLAPGVAETHNNLGAALGTAGRAGEAIAEFQEALGIDPGQAHAHVNLGFALAGQGRAAEAIPHFVEAIRLQPNQEVSHLYLGWALAETGKPADAAEQFREVLRINPNNENARRSLAMLGGHGPQPAR